MNFDWFHATQVEESDNHLLFFECKRHHFSIKNTTATWPHHKHSTGSTVLPHGLTQPKEQPRLLQQLSRFYLLPFPRKKRRIPYNLNAPRIFRGGNGRSSHGFFRDCQSVQSLQLRFQAKLTTKRKFTFCDRQVRKLYIFSLHLHLKHEWKKEQLSFPQFLLSILWPHPVCKGFWISTYLCYVTRNTGEMA